MTLLSLKQFSYLDGLHIKGLLIYEHPRMKKKRIMRTNWSENLTVEYDTTVFTIINHMG